MKISSKNIYKLASEMTEQEYNNLFNKFSTNEVDQLNRLVKMGDRKEVAMWTIISERYEETNINFYQSAFNN